MEREEVEMGAACANIEGELLDAAFDLDVEETTPVPLLEASACMEEDHLEGIRYRALKLF